MKLNIFRIALVFLTTNLFGQITVIDTDVVDVGDIIYQAYDSVPGPSIQAGNASSAAQNWNFSS